MALIESIWRAKSTKNQDLRMGELALVIVNVDVHGTLVKFPEVEVVFMIEFVLDVEKKLEIVFVGR